MKGDIEQRPLNEDGCIIVNLSNEWSIGSPIFVAVYEMGSAKSKWPLTQGFLYSICKHTEVAKMFCVKLVCTWTNDIQYV